MTSANDPFEEFLRKKKVEMLEKQFRKEGQPEHAEDDDAAPAEKWVPRGTDDDDPEREEKLAQEMNEFFEQGGRGGAELFERAKEIDEEKVEEIKEALDDVFEEPPPAPEDATADNDTFVDFFKQVVSDFDAEARETVQPDEGEPFEDEPLTADFPVPGEEEAEAEAPADPVASPLELESAPSFPEVESSDESDGTGLALAEILSPPKEGEDLRQRVDLLSRLVVKLVERSKVPESEIIEVLIKSGVEF